MSDKVFVISAPEHYSLAKELLTGVENIQFSFESNVDVGENYSEAIVKEINEADIFLTIIDDDFAENAYLIQELSAALVSLKTRAKLLISILLNGKTIPDSLVREDVQHIFYDTESPDSKMNAIIDTQHEIASWRKKTEISELSETATFNAKQKAISKSGFVGIGFLTASPVILMALPFTLDHMTGKLSDTVIGLILSIAVIVAVPLGIIGGVIHSRALFMLDRAKKEREREQYAQKIEQIVSRPDADGEKPDDQKEGESDSQKKLNALEYMGLNLENINDYYKWSQRQAKSAFALAVVICVAGFALLVVAIILAANLSVPAAVITAVGGVVTELIAGTALVVYRKSLAQLNHYHKALHEDQRFLSSVNLLDRFSTKELQDQMLQEIIRSEIRMNIAEAGWEEDEKSGKKKEEKKDDGGNH